MHRPDLRWFCLRISPVGWLSAPLKPIDGNVTLEFLIDRNSIEVFGGKGRVYMPIGVQLADRSRTLELTCQGGSLIIRNMDVHELRSIWP